MYRLYKYCSSRRARRFGQRHKKINYHQCTWTNHGYGYGVSGRKRQTGSPARQHLGGARASRPRFWREASPREATRTTRGARAVLPAAPRARLCRPPSCWPRTRAECHAAEAWQRREPSERGDAAIHNSTPIETAHAEGGSTHTRNHINLRAH